MMVIQSQEFTSKSPNRPPLGRLVIRKKDVSLLWSNWIPLKYTQHINIPNAESNWMANPTHQSLKNPALNYQACFGLFIPLDIKEMGLIVINPQVMERCWRGTRDAHGAETEVEALFLLLRRFSSGKGADLWTLIYVLDILLITGSGQKPINFLLIFCALRRKWLLVWKVAGVFLMFGGIEEERYISHILFQFSTKNLII